jgi:hypothetical protein
VAWVLQFKLQEYFYVSGCGDLKMKKVISKSCLGLNISNLGF